MLLTFYSSNEYTFSLILDVLYDDFEKKYQYCAIDAMEIGEYENCTSIEEAILRCVKHKHVCKAVGVYMLNDTVNRITLCGSNKFRQSDSASYVYKKQKGKFSL